MHIHINGESSFELPVSSFELKAKNPKRSIICSMRKSIRTVFILSCLCVSVLAQKRTEPIPFPDQFVVGHYTYFDNGPAIFEEIYIIRTTEHGNSIEKITMSPSHSSCWQPPTLESSTATTTEPIEELLQHKNPCTIPEKELTKKKKKCKHCQAYSFATTAMQVKCGTKTQLIPSFIYEDYWFDKSFKAPEITAWSMELVNHLNKLTGSDVMQKPIFNIDDGSGNKTAPLDSTTKEDLLNGRFDELFSSNYKPSIIYRDSLSQYEPPSTAWVSFPDIKPIQTTSPVFPAIAKAARMEGKVEIEFEVNSEGNVINIKTISAHPYFEKAVREAINKWKYSKDAYGQHIKTTFEFKLNCEIHTSVS